MSINKLLNFYIKHKLFLHFLKDSSLKRNLRGKRLHFNVEFFKRLSNPIKPHKITYHRSDRDRKVIL